jgi:hypothetical protein
VQAYCDPLAAGCLLPAAICPLPPEFCTPSDSPYHNGARNLWFLRAQRKNQVMDR